MKSIVRIAVILCLALVCCTKAVQLKDPEDPYLKSVTVTVRTSTHQKVVFCSVWAPTRELRIGICPSDVKQQQQYVTVDSVVVIDEQVQLRYAQLAAQVFVGLLTHDLVRDRNVASVVVAFFGETPPCIREYLKGQVDNYIVVHTIGVSAADLLAAESDPHSLPAALRYTTFNFGRSPTSQR